MEFSVNEILIVLTSVVGFVTSVAVLYQKMKKIKKLERVLASKESLIGHSLFKTLFYHRNIVLNKFCLDSETKTRVFKDILIHKIDVWGEVLLKLAREIDVTCLKECNGSSCVIDVRDLIEKNKNVLQNGCLEYTTYFSKSKEYSEEEKIQLKYAMDRFNEFHEHNVEYVIHTIEAINTNSKYTNCTKTLQSYVFTAYESSFNNMIHDAEKSLVVINGFFKDKKFKEKSYSKFPEWFIR